MPILTLNSGSSSLKMALFDEAQKQVLQGSADGIGKATGSLKLTAGGKTILEEDHVLESQPEALKKLAAHISAPPTAVGHRVVHGGPQLRDHQLITPAVLDQLRAAVHFAPLHIPAAITLIEQAQHLFPDVPHFACFDNAFHQTLPPVAKQLPLPQRYFEQGVVRYGFHGLSYESIVFRLGKKLPPRAIFAHLGSGSSVAAIRDGRSIDTSMGLTPTGGLPMSTRSGDLDPGILLYLLRTEKLSADELEKLLNHDSGLTGLSQGESDMQTLLGERNHPAAVLAVEAFTTAVRKYIGAYAALLGGVDLLVFTGGIGQHSQPIRDAVCADLDFLGLGPGSSKVQVFLAEEDLQIARHCWTLLNRALS